MRFLLLLLATFTCTTLLAQNKTWTCINTQGQKVFSIEARWVSDFSEGLAKIQQYKVVHNKWEKAYGFINKQGKIVIPCIYAQANDFKCNVTWVKKQGSDFYTLIDQSGREIPTKPYKKVGTVVKGYTNRLAVYENGAMGFINQSGKEVIPCRYAGSPLFYEGLCCVTKYKGNGLYGFINEAGQVAIPLKFKQSGTSSFHNGECRVQVNGRTVLIDKKGKIVFKTKYKSFQGFRMNRAAACTKPNRKGWGFVNRQDKMIIGGDYDYVSSFDADGYAFVEKNGLKGLIDTNGKLVLPMKYKSIYADYSKTGFYCGVYPSTETLSLSNSKKDYFLKDFIPFTKAVKYLGSANGGDLIQFANSEGQIGFMNRAGETKIPAQYKKTNRFVEGMAWVTQ